MRLLLEAIIGGSGDVIKLAAQSEPVSCLCYRLGLVAGFSTHFYLSQEFLKRKGLLGSKFVCDRFRPENYSYKTDKENDTIHQIQVNKANLKRS